MEDELAEIRTWVKKDSLVGEGNIDKAIELTYKKMTQQLIKRLRGWSK